MKPDFSPIPLAKVHKKFQFTFIISKKSTKKVNILAYGSKVASQGGCPPAPNRSENRIPLIYL